jgi:hypothetical protein
MPAPVDLKAFLTLVELAIVSSLLLPGFNLSPIFINEIYM